MHRVKSSRPRERGRYGERGAAGILGLIAVFFATAIILTVIMLFVSGVAQRGLMPRIRARAFRAVPEGIETAPPTAAPADLVVEPEVVATDVVDSSAAGLDSLRALEHQIRMGRESLDTRIERQQQEAQRLIFERAGADADARKRVSNLAKIYSSMKPEAAARVMAQLDDETFVMVLEKLNQRQAAKILVYIDPARVARLTQDAATSVAEQGR